MKIKKNELTWVNELIFILIPVPALVALLHSGFFDPHDMHHLADIYEMYRAFISGQLPPRLGPDFSFGYTYPLFNYYYLLPFYIGTLFYSLFGSLTLSFKLVLIFAVFLSYFGMYKFLRPHFNTLASISGAALFVYTPYRAVQIYVRGSLGEILALSLLPWVLYFSGRYIKYVNIRNVALGALVFFLLVISHNYFFALCVPIVIFYCVAYLKQLKQPLSRLIGIVLMFILGIGAASYWIIPALLEKYLVRDQTPFLLADHFPFIRQLVIPSWGYGSSVWGPGDELSFQIGIINLIAMAGLMILLTRLLITKHGKGSQIYIFIFAVTGFLVSFIFMNIRTLPLWQLVPFHDLIQFPWRLLSFTTLFSSVALAGIIDYVKPNIQKLVLSLSLLSMLVVGFLYFHPAKYFYKSDDVYLDLFFKTPGYSEDYLLLPRWVRARPPSRPSAVFESETVKILKQEKLGILDFAANVRSEKGAQMIANIYYFPGWKVVVNDEIVEVYPTGDYGQLAFDVPEGQSIINIKWTETPLRKVANTISIIFMLIIAFIYFKQPHLRVKK